MKMNKTQEAYIKTLLNPKPPSGNKCKKCDSEKVYRVSRYTEHCRSCDNWQVNF